MNAPVTPEVAGAHLPHPGATDPGRGAARRQGCCPRARRREYLRVAGGRNPPVESLSRRYRGTFRGTRCRGHRPPGAAHFGQARSLTRTIDAVAVTTNFQILGVSAKRQERIQQALIAAFESRPGRWHIQFLGERGDDIWETKLSGPAVETSAYLTASGDPADLAAAVVALAE